ncbi:MAG: protein kinase [Candidatus Krumholzibacteria bacterium]|nr:protein kinase [Candidatus Krumholzibacteria bacterium]
MIGKTISHYRIIEELGRGGMGVVYRAEDTKLRRTVALKFLSPGVLGTQEEAARFIHEAQAAASLNHPGICTVYEIDDAEGRSFIAMEYLEGRDLKSMIESGPLKLDNALEIAMQVAEGLKAAHGRGIIHRDIKPANVMITENGRAKIMDFGLAKSLDRTRLTKEGTTLGTAAYMSAEQARGEAADHRTDIWSLGVMLYEMVTGRVPFRGEYEQAAIYSILNEETEPITALRTGVPVELERIVDKCLAKDPAERYQTAADLIVDLCHLERTMTGQVSAKGGPSPRVAAGRRLRWIPWAVAALVLALLAVNILPRFFETAEKSIDGPPGEGRTMLAVLPFENLGRPEDEYFADGITEEITSRLAALRALGVISRTSSRQYRDTDKSIRQIGEELGVDYVLEGSVCWARTENGRDQVRITPQLIRVSDDTHLWAEPYIRAIDDIFAVQAEIAQAVVEVLDITLFEREQDVVSDSPTRNLEAYHAFLRARYYSARPHFTLENWNRAIQNYERAVSLDSDFALAHAELARAHARLHFFRHDLSKERLEMARSAAERAVELAPESPRVHIALSYYYLWTDRDVARAMKELEIAEETLHEDVDILKAKAHIWELEGRFDAARLILERAFVLSPRDAGIPADLIFICWYTRQYPEAIDAANRAVALAPDAFWPYVGTAFVHLSWKGVSMEGRAALEAVPKETPWAAYSWYLQELFEGDFRGAIESLGFSSGDWILVKMWGEPKPLLAAVAHELLGEQERARELYEIALDMLEQRVGEWPEDPRLHSSLGITYASLGRKEEAIREGKLAVELLPVSKDAIYGLPHEFDLALIYTIAGEYDLALDQVERLMSIPSWLSPAWLRTDPRFNRLREHPRFREIIEAGE